MTRDELIQRHYGSAVNIGRHQSRHAPASIEESIADALLALVEACDRIDRERHPAELNVYLRQRMAGAVVDGIRKRTNLHRATGQPRQAISLDWLRDRADDEQGGHGYEFGADDPGFDVITARESIGPLLEVLDDKQRDVIVRADLHGEPLHKIAADYGLSPARISQIRTAALERMSHAA